MNEILRDRATATIRLVMNPDRMVIDEAQRTFTYLNLYGYLTDAVIVNRVFPDDVDGYFGGWRERQQEHLRLVEGGFAPVPVLTARYFDEEVIGERMLDRLAGELFAEHRPEAVLHTELAHDVVSENGRTVLRPANAIRGARGREPEEGWPRAGRDRGTREANYHPALRPGAPPPQRCQARGGLAGGELRG